MNSRSATARWALGPSTGPAAPTRRRVLALAGAAALAGTGWAGATAVAGDAPRPRARRAYIGGFTIGEYGLPGLAGIGIARVGNGGELEVSGWRRGIENPSFLTLSPDRRRLYAVSQLPEGATGAIHAYRIDGDELHPLGRPRSSHGAAPVHLAVHPGGRFLLTTNYDSGHVAVLPVHPDGSLDDAVQVLRHRGHGPHPDEQRGPHPHMIAFDPAGRRVLVPDKGDDHIHVYDFDTRTGRLTPSSRTRLGEGIGPRHLVFHPSGRLAYVTNELGHTVTVLTYDPVTGRVRPVSHASVAPPGIDPRNAPSAVHLTRDGGLLITADRGLDTVESFRVENAGRTLTLLESQPVTAKAPGTRWPRDVALDASDRFVYTANQAGQSVSAFRLDPATGRLTPAAPPLHVASPSCVLLR
ncbi:lactonase family protein [Streptomyces himalayensis]|uniref:Lactonase family protein n=1 Tax=Streptomyces himalayensis subsp. himalayensis TaxID=2756131 RepID=A0A7W0DHL2_9ACTN|nr:lactonase family protein [Streptomyces himalayensis]MBA2944529.1 lactonase family protein [Streptomyces himalayensis subsp. himalayensis]